MSHDGYRGSLSAEDYRREREEAGVLAFSVTISVFLVPLIILARLAIFINTAPGRDLNADGVFSIADVIRGLEYAFNEPAWWAMAAIPATFWQFFEISSWQLPGTLVFSVAVVCWIAIAIALAFAAYWIGKVFIVLGRGASFGIGRVQLRLPQLMAMDVVLIAVAVVVFGGLALSWLITSLN